MKRIDFHAHILPRCDHGSDSLTTSLKQLELAQKAEIDIVCATPHYYAHKESVEDFLKRRNESLELLRNHNKNVNTEILAGAEVLAFEGIEKLRNLHSLCLENTNILLLEMPFFHWSDGLVNSVEQLCLDSDLQIVLAHVDRYSTDGISRLCESEALCQLNVDSMGGFFVKRNLKSLIKNGFVVALGSDIHSAEKGYSTWIQGEKRNRELFSCVLEKTDLLISAKKTVR